MNFKVATFNILIALLVAGELAFAQVPKKILDRPARPTMEEISEIQDLIKAEEGIPVPEQNAETYNFKNWLKIMIDDGPKFIASLEATFPGATWAFMGRDTAALADLVEAFYLSIGQNGRVVRVPMSKATQASSSEGMFIKMLEGIGFDLKKVNSQEHPFILVDTVSSGGGRQGRALIKMIYDKYKAKGGEPADLLWKFNMIGLIVSTFRLQEVPLKDVKELLTKDDKDIRGKKDIDYGATHTIVHFRDSGKKFSEAGYDHFTAAWHESYTKLEEDDDGIVRGKPGKLFAIEFRKTILWFQKKILEAVSKDEFLERVKKEAKKLGYEFPLNQTKQEKPGKKADDFDKELEALREKVRNNDINIRAAKAPDVSDIKQAISEMERLDSDETTISRNGNKIYAWFTKNAESGDPTRAGIEAIRLMIEARDRRVINSKDMKKLMNKVFELAQPCRPLISGIAKAMDESKAMNKMMRESEWVEGKSGEQTYNDIKKLMGLKTKCGLVIGD